MRFTFLKVLTIALALLAITANTATAKEPKVDREYIESVIHDYIMENPDVFMKALIKYQKENVLEQQQVSLSVYADDVFKSSKSPIAGNPKGDITIAEFMDYNCGYCKQAADTLNKLIEKDKNIKVVFRELPVLGPSSEAAAKWALAAQRQGKYFEYHMKLMENKRPITESLLENIAKDLDLDLEKMKTDAESDSVKRQILEDKTLAGKLKLRGTPVFVIGETVNFGAMSLEKMEKVVADERSKLGMKKKK